MDNDFWVQRWKEGKIGWHEGATNFFLERHVERLGSARRVLVPLCGKTEDMAFLRARGHEVVGIDVAEAGLRAFFREHELEPVVEDRGAVQIFHAEGITLLRGDVFDCTPELVGQPDAFYDRAALVALPPEVRGRYVAHVRSLLASASPGLVVTFEYPQETFEPPPYSVTEAEVRERFAGAAAIERLDERPLAGSRLKEAGVEGTEACLLVRL